MEAPLYPGATSIATASPASAAVLGHAARPSRSAQHYDACRTTFGLPSQQPASPPQSLGFALSKPSRLFREPFHDADTLCPRSSCGLDPASLSNYTTRASSNVSPLTTPHSGSPPTGPFGLLKINEMHSPVLKIRRPPSSNSSSIPRNVSDLSLGEAATTEAPARRHRRRSTGALAIDDDEPAPPESRSRRSSESLVLLTIDEAPKCYERSCGRHHHRQSSTSTVSIKFGSDEGSRSPTTEPDMESSITFEPMPVDMLVPLVDRPTEMAELLAHPTNRRLGSMIEHAVGKECYKNKLLPLWTKTGREEVYDMEWLRQSKKMLMKKSHDGRVWREFCGMVGWDEVVPLDVDHAAFTPRGVTKRQSTESMGSQAIQMNIITEEDEEEDDESRCSKS